MFKLITESAKKIWQNKCLLDFLVFWRIMLNIITCTHGRVTYQNNNWIEKTKKKEENFVCEMDYKFFSCCCNKSCITIFSVKICEELLRLSAVFLVRREKTTLKVMKCEKGDDGSDFWLQQGIWSFVGRNLIKYGHFWWNSAIKLIKNWFLDEFDRNL